MNSYSPDRKLGGIVHTYRKYDPRRFPMPDADPPDLVSPAFEHVMAFGTMRHLTPEELTEAIEIDPRQITGLGPSIESLQRMLEERKRKILETYEVQSVQRESERVFRDKAKRVHPPKRLKKKFERALRLEQNVDFERLWYQAGEQSDFAKQVLQVNESMVDRDEIAEMSSKYAFSGHASLSIPEALAIKEELETIDRLLRQLEEAKQDAKIYVIDMEALAEFASEEQMDNLSAIQRQVEEMLRHQAQEQGLLGEKGRLQLTPKAYRIFQGKLLNQIFSELQVAKTGRHQNDITGDGAVEMQQTKRYEFGDSLANLDVTSSMINAMLRGGPDVPVRMKPGDLEIHLMRNRPKCATSVLMDMSGSMQWDGMYINVKRMALALHGLIRGEYPGDFLDFAEVATFAHRKHVSQILELMPKPVTIREPVVRLMADMSDPDLSTSLIPPHFTNIQHGLRVAKRVLEVQDTPNRQIILITDGLPTAHFEDQHLYMLYPPHPRTADATKREGLMCKEAGIVINIFLLHTWSQSSEDVQFAHQLAETTSGRVLFVSGGELDRFVVWDYVKRRRLIIG